MVWMGIAVVVVLVAFDIAAALLLRSSGVSSGPPIDAHSAVDTNRPTLALAGSSSADQQRSITRWADSGPSATSFRLLVNTVTGVIAGRLSARTRLQASLITGGTLRASGSTTTNGSGDYVLPLSWDAGHGPGIHNGDQVTVSAGGATYQETVRLAGFFDEQTGELSATATPQAQLDVRLFTNGDIARDAWSGSLHADATGHVAFAPPPVVKPTGPPQWPWRGYQASIVSRDQPDSAVFTDIQTPNTTLVSTRNQAGGGYFVPGDRVTFSLSRGAAVVATADAVADADGIPQATLGADVGLGDVLGTTYHTPKGAVETQTLLGWDLTVQVDLHNSRVSGVTGPGSRVEADYGLSGGAPIGLKTLADGTGHYVVDFGAQGVKLIGGVPVVVFRIADPGLTGVGAQQVELRSPFVALDPIRSEVSGYGAPSVGPVTVNLVRHSQIVATAGANSAKDGGFLHVVLGREVLPGDRIDVTAGGQNVPHFAVGDRPFTARAVDRPALPGGSHG
jgi:hypothetical protein